jgi:hypothetical protein
VAGMVTLELLGGVLRDGQLTEHEPAP